MLDGDSFSQRDDSFDEQADEALAPGEVERLQAVPDGSSEGFELGPQPLHACPLGALSL